MFPQQQQHFQQQLLQLQQLIHQQRQQHHRHHHPHPPPPQPGPNRAMQQQPQKYHHHHPHQQQRHQHRQQQQQQQEQLPQLNLHPSSQASLLNPNPMLQRALIMQQMQGGLHGYSMSTPGLQPFFPPGSRASILGTPPLGIQLQTPRIRFGNQLFQQHNRGFNKDMKRMHDMRRDRYSPREPFRAKMDVKWDANKVNTEPGTKQSTGNKHVDAKKAADFISLKTEESIKADEPEVKRRRLESKNDDVTEQSNSGEPNTSKSTMKEDELKKGTSEMCETDECEESGIDQNLEHNTANTEMLSTMSTLKVTIQQSSESRAISTSAPDSGSKGNEDSIEELDSIPTKFICYICNVNCYNQKNFQKHMTGTRHHQRLLEIQQMSNACLATLIPQPGSMGRGRESDKKRPRWCSTCQAHFRGNVIEHRRTQRHKVKLQRSSLDKDQAGQDDPEDMITVDAVGCFDEDDEEGMTEDDDSGSDCLSDGDSQQAFMSEFQKEPYDAETVYGQEFVVPVTGFLCKLCHKFYHSESTARFTHCKSLMHFQNLQSYKVQRAQDYLSVSYQEPAASVVNSLGSTDDQKPEGEKQPEKDLKSANVTANHPEMEEASCEVETPTPSGHGIVPSVEDGNNKDSSSPSQNFEQESPDGSDQGGTIIGDIPVSKFDCKLTVSPRTKNEMPSGKVEGEQGISSDKCESSSVMGSEVADEEQDGNEECDLSSSKAEEPSETEDGEEEHMTDSCLTEKECEETNVKSEENELGEEDGHLERNIPKTRSGRVVRGRRLSSRRKK
ncbi:cip1-interacting zinc finger protein-like isoform X2 [Pristis pectinata]|uniref:cip1-interacting zinc finger protein-like isoform X2 n=1 Tax=Pristis pectinata TaxID=685728 RepID=UPI00223E0682|nr:cip1-interacting zinc finger protein-like isoform X2 [Pristis pectinata]